MLRQQAQGPSHILPAQLQQQNQVVGPTPGYNGGETVPPAAALQPTQTAESGANDPMAQAQIAALEAQLQALKAKITPQPNAASPVPPVAPSSVHGLTSLSSTGAQMPPQLVPAGPRRPLPPAVGWKAPTVRSRVMDHRSIQSYITKRAPKVKL